jgi:hypothetical protein
MKKMSKILFAACLAVLTALLAACAGSPAANTPGDTDTGLVAGLERLRRQDTAHRGMNEAYGKNGG